VKYFTANGKFVCYGLSIRGICVQVNYSVKYLMPQDVEDHELVTKKIYAQVPPKVEYSLTDFGKTLVPVISTLGFWGDEHENRLRKVILKRMEASQDLASDTNDVSTL
jgi:hypothetical protein